MKNKIIIILALILVLVVVGVNVYKYKNDNSKNENSFIQIKLEVEKKDDIDGEVLDKDKYAEKIITEDVLFINYNFFDDKESITGKIYIGEDKYLYISDVNKNTEYRVSTTKFKTMYAKDSDYKNLYVHLISEDNKLYFMILAKNNISNATVVDTQLDMKVTNFVDVTLNNDMYTSSRAVFVLTDEGRIYDSTSLLRYDEEIKSIFNSLYVFGDDTISNTSGLMLKDKSGRDYKIKYVFLTQEDSDLIDEGTVVVITDENELIYIDKNLENVYEFNKKVKDVKFDVYYPYVNGNLTITFENDSKIDLNAQCNQFYCINEFAE